MTDPTRIFYIVFGLFTILGGVMGFVKASSTASLVAGGISGILLLVAAYLLRGNVTPGLILGGIVCLALAGRFVPAYLSTHKIMPAGITGILAVIGIVLTAVAFLKK